MPGASGLFSIGNPNIAGRRDDLLLIPTGLNATIADQKEPSRMARGQDDLRADIATAARAFSLLNYVHTFGHFSVRLENSLLITPTRPPLAVQRAGDVLEVDFEGHVTAGEPAARPIEVFLHIGIYEQRPAIRAICRTHAPFASAWPANGEAPAIQHGFGGLAGEIALYNGFDLIHNGELGKSAAKHLGNADALILRGNGVLTVGRTLGEAAARMWGLEERCAQPFRQGYRQVPLGPGELEARARWYPAEAERIWTWLKYLGASSLAREGAAS
jgi:HCOMODA/2-hydroxy-3-carboxy-muconic semialdehyde decarboxylase